MVGRRTCEAEMERELSTKPFETYQLYRGQKFGVDEEESTYREVGKFKVRPTREKQTGVLDAVMQERAASQAVCLSACSL